MSGYILTEERFQAWLKRASEDAIWDGSALCPAHHLHPEGGAGTVCICLNNRTGVEMREAAE